MEASQPVTSAEVEGAKTVSTAAGEAIATTVESGGTEEQAREAARAAAVEKAEAANLPVTKKQLFEMVDIMLDRMREMGVFEAPPTPPPAVTPAAAQTPEAAAAAEAAAAEVTPPQKKSWAERFAGL